MNWDTVVIHYDEIGLKGNNRGYFERLLIANIQKKIGALISIISIIREPGQITLKLPKRYKAKNIQEILTKIPGIAYFSFANGALLEKELIKKTVLELLKTRNYKSFKINTRRRDKNNKLSSIEWNSFLGQAVVDKYHKKVKMSNPDIVVKVEISNKYSYISLEDIKGIGGLPTDQKQKMVALLSGGFDSPVASYLMMRRGCEIIFVHLHNSSQQPVKTKIIRLCEQLSKYQIKTILYLVPFDDIQKEIIKHVKSDLRMLVYRRFMLLVSSKIAEMHKAQFLVVGDSLSQVASQTFENLAATYSNLPIQIISPLIGFDKREIIMIAKKIGTYDISALPYGDCCSYFISRHPSLRSDTVLIQEQESKFDISRLIEASIRNSRVYEW